MDPSLGTIGLGILEREREVGALADLFEHAGSGRGGVVVLEGPAGIGKSRLCSEAAAAATERGMTVLTAHGGELEHQLTYGVTQQLFERTVEASDPTVRDALLAGTAHLALPAIGDIREAVDSADSGASAESGIAHGLYWLVSNLAAEGPLALVVDDAHWADAASLRALVYLARRIDGLPVALVVAARTEEPGTDSLFVEMLGDERLSQRLPLAPLSEAGCSQLLDARVSTPWSAAVGTVCRKVSGGNPFFVGELGEMLTRLDEGSDPVEAIRSAAPSTVARSVIARIRKLGDDAVTVSQALSVAGDNPFLDLLAAASKLEQRTVVAALEELEAVGIVTSSTTLGFRHPILRTAVYQDMHAGRRALLHSGVAKALADRGAPLEEVANHLLVTLPAADSATVATLREVARRALVRNSPADGVALLERAVIEPPRPAQRTTVLAELGEAQLRAGNPAAAVTTLQAAVADLPSTDLVTAAAVALAKALHLSEGPSAAVSVLEQINVDGDEESALRLEIERASMAGLIPALNPQVQNLIGRFTELPGDTPNERMALALASLYATRTLDTAEIVERTARRALGDGKLLAEQTADSTQWAFAIFSLIYSESLDLVDREVERAFADARDRGSAFGFDSAAIFALMAAVGRGDLMTASAHGEALLDQRDSQSLFDAMRISVAYRWYAEALLERGEVDQARSVIDQGVELGGDLTTFTWGGIRYARGLCALSQGDFTTAIEDLVGYGETCAALSIEDRLSPWRRHAALAAHAIGRHDDAIGFATEDLADATAWGTPGAIGASLRVGALVGPRDETLSRLGAAIRTLEASFYRLEHARALVDYGAALRRAGQRKDARVALETGLDLAARFEARPLIGRAQEELSVLGAKPRRLRYSGLEGLTAAERRVAQMAAEGLTNREIAQSLFVTMKTVETHLAAVYRKLDVRSRKDLPGRLAQTA